MQRLRLVIGLIAIPAILLLASSSSQAERIARSFLSSSKLQLINSTLTATNAKFPLTTLHLRVPNLGAVRVRVTSSRLKNWLSERRLAPENSFTESQGLFLAQGVLKALRSKYQAKVALAFFPDQSGYTLSLHLLEGKRVGNTYVRYPNAARGVTLSAFRHTERASLHKLNCLSAPTQNPEMPQIAAATEQGSETSVRVLELATVADFELFSILGERTNNIIASIVNATDLLYQSSFGIQLKIVHQEVLSLPNSELNSFYPEILLQQLKNSRTNSPIWGDLVHLFSGKQLLEQTIGIAYTGSVCSEMQYRFGITEYIDGVSEHLIFAHELGHSMGATHDDFSGANLMSSVLNPQGTTFSSFSARQITTYLSRYSQCLAIEGPPREELSVHLIKEANRRRFYRLQLKLTNDQGWLSSRLAQIMYRRSKRESYVLLGQVQVDERGNSISTRLRGQYLVQLINQPESAQTVALKPRKKRR